MKSSTVKRTSRRMGRLKENVKLEDSSNHNQPFFSKPFVEITHKLVKPCSDLYSFAIWGRKFVQDQDPNAAVPVSIGSTLLVLVAAVCSIMFK